MFAYQFFFFLIAFRNGYVDCPLHHWLNLLEELMLFFAVSSEDGSSTFWNLAFSLHHLSLHLFMMSLFSTFSCLMPFVLSQWLYLLSSLWEGCNTTESSPSQFSWFLPPYFSILNMETMVFIFSIYLLCVVGSGSSPIYIFLTSI